MEKASCYNDHKKGLKKGTWSEEEDDKLRAYIQRYGHWNWALLPKFAGVKRSGKSCRLRWMNYLRPNMKHGNFTEEEDDMIINLHNKIGNKWSTIAANLPGRSDNEVKNRWNTRLKKQVQNDQTFSGSCEIIGVPQANPTNPKLNEQELDITLGRESCESPSTSTSSTDLFSCSLHGGVNCTISNDFWIDAFPQDSDSIVPSGENLYSPLNYVDDFISQSSCQSMMINDEFVWSTMDTYVEDNIWNL